MRSGASVSDVVVIVAVAGAAAGLIVSAGARAHEKGSRSRCSSNLRQIALAAIQYADDERAFPQIADVESHIDAGRTLPSGNDVPPRALRALVHHGYLDDPQLFICPQSLDEHVPMTDRVKRDPRLFGWGGRVETGQDPLVRAGTGDADANALTDLSYGWTIRRLGVNARSDTVLSADRARFLGSVETTDGCAGVAQTIAGNHRDGWNVVHVDGHGRFVASRDEDARTLSRTLVVWDDANNGHETLGRFEPDSSSPREALERGKRARAILGGVATLVTAAAALAALAAGLRWLTRSPRGSDRVSRR